MKQTQKQMYYAAVRRAAEINKLFLEMVSEGMTREELKGCIDRRPALWGRFSVWLDKLPSGCEKTKPDRKDNRQVEKESVDETQEPQKQRGTRLRQ